MLARTFCDSTTCDGYLKGLLEGLPDKAGREPNQAIRLLATPKCNL